MLVEGPAGIGKSSLLRAVAERARAAGMMALTARGGELERTFAFGLVRELFERPLVRDAELRARVLSGAARLAAAIVAPDADGGPAPDSPGAAHHALYWLTANLSERQPVLLILDDLQWADAGSLGWVLHLTRRLGDLQVAVAAAWRTGEPGCDEVSAGYLRDEPRPDSR
jgi:predicted ATPase